MKNKTYCQKYLNISNILSIHATIYFIYFLFIPANASKRPDLTKVSIYLYLDIFANFSSFFSVLLLDSISILIYRYRSNKKKARWGWKELLKEDILTLKYRYLRNWCRLFEMINEMKYKSSNSTEHGRGVLVCTKTVWWHYNKNFFSLL